MVALLRHLALFGILLRRERAKKTSRKQHLCVLWGVFLTHCIILSGSRLLSYTVSRIFSSSSGILSIATCHEGFG
jgi:hypothetical protein